MTSDETTPAPDDATEDELSAANLDEVSGGLIPLIGATGNGGNGGVGSNGGNGGAGGGNPIR